MIEKVNPSHPDKTADRVAGAIVDLAYQVQPDPKIAVEVLIGHGVCHIIVETSTPLLMPEAVKAIHNAVRRIAGMVQIDLIIVPQDVHLADNQSEKVRCGDNGIFKGIPLTDEQKKLSGIAHDLYGRYPFDGKYILNGDCLIICRSNTKSEQLCEAYPDEEDAKLARITGNKSHEYSMWDVGKLHKELSVIGTPFKTAFFTPNRDRKFFSENKLLIFGNNEISITEEEYARLKAVYDAYIAENKNYLGFVMFLTGGDAE